MIYNYIYIIYTTVYIYTCILDHTGIYQWWFVCMFWTMLLRLIPRKYTGPMSVSLHLGSVQISLDQLNHNFGHLQFTKSTAGHPYEPSCFWIPYRQCSQTLQNTTPWWFYDILCSEFHHLAFIQHWAKRTWKTEWIL